MQNIFQKYPDAILVACTIAFIGIIVACAVWDVSNLTQQAGRAFSEAGANAPMATFNLRGAAALDLRGFVPSPIPPAGVSSTTGAGQP